MENRELLRELLGDLRFPHVSTAYIDATRKGIPVCAGCGSYYVVDPDTLKEIRAKIMKALDSPTS